MRIGRTLRASLGALSACISVASAADSARHQILPSEHPIGHLVVQIAPVGVTHIAANGIVIGKNGCYVLTNFHVAFGKDKDRGGTVVLVPDIRVGHEVEVKVDLGATGTFSRILLAKVIEFGNYRQRDRRSLKHDLALLKLPVCLGPSYGILQFEMPDSEENIPVGELSTLSLKAISERESVLNYERGCKSGADTNIAGIFYQSCETEGGMSGSPVLRRKSDGTYTIVGLASGVWAKAGEPDVPFAIYSSAFTPFVTNAIGSQAVRFTPKGLPPAR